MKAPFVPLLCTSIGIFLSTRLLQNSVARFVDYWMPNADRRLPRAVVKIYKIVAIAFGVFFLLVAVLGKMGYFRG
jgi:hypothetical protein